MAANSNMKVWASRSAGAGEQPPGLVAASPADGGPPTGEDTTSAAAAGDANGEVSKEACLQYTPGLIGCSAACALEIAWRNAPSDIESDVGDAPAEGTMEGTSVLPEAVVVVEVERAVLVHVRARFGDEPTGDPQGEPRGEPAHGDAIRKNAKRKYKEKNTKDTSREIPRST